MTPTPAFPRAPLLSRSLREHGMTAAAQELDAARDADHEIWALHFALGAVDGASLVLRTHARVLRSASDRAKRDRLQILADELTARLGDLVRRRRATAARAGDTDRIASQQEDTEP